MAKVLIVVHREGSFPSTHVLPDDSDTIGKILQVTPSGDFIFNGTIFYNRSALISAEIKEVDSAPRKTNLKQ